ncbi:MAG: ribonuclease III family protein [Metamycoplasmataceae bacterium]
MINKFSEKNIIEVKKILKKYQLNYKKEDFLLKYLRAFTHSSFANQNNIKSYETLEFFGDAIIQYCVSNFIIEKIGIDELDAERGTKIRSKSVDTDSLSKISKNIGLNNCLIVLNPKEEMMNNPKICEDIFESFVAVIYLNEGMKKVKDFLSETLFIEIEKNILHKEILEVTDNKSKLQELIQGNQSNDEKIEYKCEQSSDKISWTCIVKWGDKIFGTGTGKRKKDAEQKAAQKALSMYKK